MLDVTLILSLATSALPEEIDESLIWEREIALPVWPNPGLVLVLDSETPDRAIDVVVDTEMECRLKNGDDIDALLVHCHLRNEEDVGAASRALDILKSNMGWVREQ